MANMEGTILFSVVGRTHYGFDIFSVNLPKNPNLKESLPFTETQLTDGISVNFNGSFASSDSADGNHKEKLVYVSERTGGAKLYINSEKTTPELGPLKCLLTGKGDGGDHSDLFFDRPSIHGNKVYFVSTQQVHHTLRQSWTAVYASSLETGHTVRLTPPNVADLSPSLSPSGKWIAAASYQDNGWQGEVEDLHTDIYVFNAEDGMQRRMVAKNGGWPTWADDETLYFHRKSDDGWWSVYKTCNWAEEDGLAEAERITPPCVHVLTPAASTTGNWLAVATRRPNSKWRHVEIFDLASKEFIEVTAGLNAEKHHYNPFVAAGSGRLGYHRCRDVGEVGADVDGKVAALSPNNVARLEGMECPVAGLALVRVDGFFPSVSPCGRFIAYNKSLPGGDSVGLFVMRSDGSKAWNLSRDPLFYTTWDPLREGVIYCTAGAIFAPASAGVQVAALHFSLDALTDNVDEVPSRMQLLTCPDTGNNGFPAPSPDGKWLVFRSGRGGGNSKNLYIMDAEHGEKMNIRRLTCGEWTDTMPSWSPDGEWIAFSSTMDGVDGGSFGLYMMRPDGTGLHRVEPGGDCDGTQGAVHGRINHVKFSPDGCNIVFTADIAGVSAEPISLPNQFQPYGDIFVARADGSGLVRLTHNAYEDGTPTWTSATMKLLHQQPSAGPAFIASTGTEPLRGDFVEPLWLNRVTEEMRCACC